MKIDYALVVAFACLLGAATSDAGDTGTPTTHFRLQAARSQRLRMFFQFISGIKTAA